MQDIAIYLNQNFNRSHGCNCAKIVFADENGKKSSRLVEIGSLLKALKKSIVETVELTPIGEIPFGYYNGAVGINNNKLRADIVAVLPASMQMMQYENTQYDVCVPSLVFSFHVDKGRLEKTRVFVLKDDKPVENSLLYRYPFGNVSDDGFVCWGSNIFPDILEIKGLEMVMTLFIQSPCNSDLYESEKCIGKKDMPLRELFEQLHNKQNFPEEYLMPIKTQRGKMCLKDLMTWKK